MTEFTTKQNKKLQEEANKIYKYRNTKKLFTPEEEDKYLKGVSSDYSKRFAIPSSIITNKINEFIGYNVAEDKINKRKQALNSNPLLEKRQIRNEGGEMDQQMDMLMGMEQEQTMLPDEEMEEDYVDYVVEETLSNEDRNYLIDALEKDDKLSEIFDQVVESATEFTGSGTVEGPGTAKSDSIPARLSDGEFVFTTKATAEIGADNLMSMMKDAEAAVDERQTAYDGGMIREEKEVMAAPKEPIQQNINVTKSTVDNGAVMPRAQQSPIKAAIKEDMMLDPYQRHVRS